MRKPRCFRLCVRCSWMTWYVASTPATGMSRGGKGSDVETFCALRLFIDSWRWAEGPWYLRSGKYMAESAAEVLVVLKPPPQDSPPTQSPRPVGQTICVSASLQALAVALAARVRSVPEKNSSGDQRELYLIEEQPGEEFPYERLLGDAMAGDGALFTREDAVEAAWAVVDPVLQTHHRGSALPARKLGPEEADAIIAANGGWHNPSPKEASGA